MELVLLLHISQYDENLARFRSTCFENSGDGTGISVFERQCAEETSGSICAHARAYYSSVANEPPVFWTFDEVILPNGYFLEEVPSDTGDDCHRNIEGLSDNRAKKFFKKQENPLFRICDGNDAQLLTHEGIQHELDKYKQSLR